MQQPSQRRFPIFIVVEPEDVEHDSATGLAKLKKGYGIQTAKLDDGHRGILVFTSMEAAAQFSRSNKLGEKSAVAIENEHDFVATFKPYIKDGVDRLIVDLVNPGDRPTISVLQPMLDAMQAKIDAQLKQ